MHRYRTVAQISLILSILNPVLAAPIVVQEIREARRDEMVLAEDVTAIPEKRQLPGSEAASDQSTTPGLSPYLSTSSDISPDHSMSTGPSPDEIASQQHSYSSAGSTSSGYSAQHLSSYSSASGNTWMLERPPRPDSSLNPPPASHRPVFLRPSGVLLPAWLQDLTPARPPYPESEWEESSLEDPEVPEISLPSWAHEMASEIQPSLDSATSFHESASPHPSNPGSLASEMSFPSWFEELAPEEIPSSPSAGGQELAPSLSHSGSSDSSMQPVPEYATYSPSDRFTSSHLSSSSSTGSAPYDSSESITTSHTAYSSASGGSLSSHYITASEGSPSSHYSIQEELLPVNHLASDAPSHLPSPLPMETPSDNVRFFNENMVKKIKIVAGAIAAGGAIAGVVGSHIKHHHRDDS